MIVLTKFIMRSVTETSFMIIRVEAFSFAVKAKFITRRSKLVTANAIAEISGLRVGAKALIKTGGTASIEGASCCCTIVTKAVIVRATDIIT